MTLKNLVFLAATTALLSLSIAGCSRDNSQEPAPPNIDPIVFDDLFGSGVIPQAFEFSKLDAVSIDTNEKYEGAASIKISVPGPGDPSGGYAGGAFTTDLARDLSGYNAMTFWAKSSVATTMDVAGLGNDNTGNSKFEARWSGIPLTTAWTKFVVPIPLPARLTSEQGLFFYANGPEGDVPHTIWMDEIKFETVATITNPRPVMSTRTVSSYVGATEAMTGTQVTFNVDGTDRVITHHPGYFTYTSSNTAVATVDKDSIRVVGVGSTMITAKLGDINVNGTVTLNSTQDPVPPNIVFDDGFATGVDFQAFAGSKVDAVGTDDVEKYAGTSSLKIMVPGPGDPSGGYAGGAFTIVMPRNLTTFNCLTFWTKSSKATVLDIAGLGNDNTGTSKYEASRVNIPVSTTWTKVIIPIPLAARLTVERGLFFFAEGPEGGVSHTLWFDEVKFETLATITNPRPTMTTQTVEAIVNAIINPAGTRVTFNVDGTDRVVQHQPGYFTFASSNGAAVSVMNDVVRAVGLGTSVITARLGNVDATGALTVNVTGSPTAAAPTPAVAGSNVISLFSNPYTNVTVDSWSTNWDFADVSDLKISGNDTKLYSINGYAAIEFTSQPINATTMTHFHMDVWVPAGTIFKVKLVDFGQDGLFEGAPDSEHELILNAGSTPPLSIGSWVSLEIPMASFTGLAERAHLAQMILSGDIRTVYVDNVYFHR